MSKIKLPPLDFPKESAPQITEAAVRERYIVKYSMWDKKWWVSRCSMPGLYEGYTTESEAIEACRAEMLKEGK